MEITSCGYSNSPITPQSQVEATAASGNQSAASTSSNSSAYTPSSELTRLLDQVRAQPEVRGDRVLAAAERLQQGYYNSPASFAQTAQAMIQAGN